LTGLVEPTTALGCEITSNLERKCETGFGFGGFADKSVQNQNLYSLLSAVFLKGDVTID
jgi:hypothetical protein